MVVFSVAGYVISPKDNLTVLKTGITKLSLEVIAASSLVSQISLSDSILLLPSIPIIEVIPSTESPFTLILVPLFNSSFPEPILNSTLLTPESFDE